MEGIYKNMAMTLWRHALLLAVAVAAVSCGDENAVIPGEPTPSGDGISVSIALAGQKPSQTRGAGEDSDDTSGEFGTDAENYINMDDLYVMTFSIPEGSSVLTDDSELLEILWAPTGANHKTESSVSSNGETVYLATRLDASIAQYASGKDFCIVALANMKGFPAYPGNSGVRPAAGMKFSALVESARYCYKGTRNGQWSWMPDNTKSVGIPVFGVKRVNLKGYDPKYHNEWNPFQLAGSGNSTVWLLRAFAKVEVRLSDALKNLTLNGVVTDVKIKNVSIGSSYSSDFWLMPELSRFSGFSETGSTGLINSCPTFSTWPSNPASPENILSFNVSEDATNATVYLPEYDMSDNKPVITLTLEIGGMNHEFSFEFKPYSTEGGTSDGMHASWLYILRNNYYLFKIDVGFNIISVEPEPWTGICGNDFEFGAGQTTSPVKPWDNAVGNDYEF